MSEKIVYLGLMTFNDDTFSLTILLNFLLRQNLLTHA